METWDLDEDSDPNLDWDLVDISWSRGKWYVEWREGGFTHREQTRTPFRTAASIIRRLQGR